MGWVMTMLTTIARKKKQSEGGVEDARKNKEFTPIPIRYENQRLATKRKKKPLPLPLETPHPLNRKKDGERKEGNKQERRIYSNKDRV